MRKRSPKSGTLITIVDTGPLVSAANERDLDHQRCVEIFARADLQFVVPVMVVAEATYLVEQLLGGHAEARFLAGLTSLEIEPPVSADWDRIVELVDRYADLNLGGTDASVVATAERLATDSVFTLDRRRYSVVRPRHVEAFELMPDD